MEDYNGASAFCYAALAAGIDNKQMLFYVRVVQLRNLVQKTYTFPDKSTVTIRISDGRVLRTPAPRSGPNGRNINKGRRLGRDGSLLQTRDQFGNQIPNTHDSGEFVR